MPWPKPMPNPHGMPYPPPPMAMGANGGHKGGMHPWHPWVVWGGHHGPCRPWWVWVGARWCRWCSHWVGHTMLPGAPHTTQGLVWATWCGAVGAWAFACPHQPLAHFIAGHCVGGACTPQSASAPGGPKCMVAIAWGLGLGPPNLWHPRAFSGGHMGGTAPPCTSAPTLKFIQNVHGCGGCLWHGVGANCGCPAPHRVPPTHVWPPGPPFAHGLCLGTIAPMAPPWHL